MDVGSGGVNGCGERRGEWMWGEEGRMDVGRGGVNGCGERRGEWMWGEEG